ncbi:intein-containing [Micractinium conductrix]|uniref:Intein-containing n=1 Tax=Micractinium conductrix TaxID=554055 RepID=A0A2P6V7W6_9CHLO|nr:intein-containing [Micractinium conductrix]|eukprot:PSC70179.1 intein-containing [Micractinium conductrix]
MFAMSVLVRNAEAERLTLKQFLVPLRHSGSYPDVPENLGLDTLLAARSCIAKSTRAQGRDPGKLLPTIKQLCELATPFVAALPSYCHDVYQLGLCPVALRAKPGFIEVRPSTNSGDRFCSDSSWVLTPDGSEQLVDGQRVPARHNELKHNLLVQFALLSGLTNGNSRGLEQHQAGQLMMQPEAFQMGLVAGAVSTDGCRKASKEGKEYFRVSQGRHCGHDSIVEVVSTAARRCEVGGLTHAGVEYLTVDLRGPRLPELSALIRAGHKQLPPCMDHSAYTVQYLRPFSVEPPSGLHLCIRISLKGGAQLVRTACSVGLLLGD